MKLTCIALILCQCGFVYGLPIYKKELKEMYAKEQMRLLNNNIKMDYIRIFREIEERAKAGKNESHFMLQCEYYYTAMEHHCIKSNSPAYLQENGILTLYPLNLTLYTKKIIKKFTETFPDSIIYKKETNCCDYRISW
jgi:hypothetical protein